MKKLYVLIFTIIFLVFNLIFEMNCLLGEPTWGQHYYMGTAGDLDDIKGDTTYILDNSTKKIVFRFTVTNSSSISVGRIRLRVNTADDAHIRIETVDGSGNPTGTLVDANAEVDYTSGSASISFPAAFSLNGGTTYAIVITKAASATTTKIQVSDNGSFANKYYADGTSVGDLSVMFSSDGTTYTEVSGVSPIFGLRPSSGKPDPIIGTPFQYGTSAWTTNSLGAGEMFECPTGGLNVSGVYVVMKRRSSPSQIPTIIIDEMSQIDISGASINRRLIKGKMNSVINDSKWWLISFPTNIVLTAGNNYAFKVMVDSYDPSSDCIIFPAGSEWWDYDNIVTPPSGTTDPVHSGYAINCTNGHWGTLKAGSSGEYTADISFKFRLVEATSLASATIISPTNNAIVTTTTPTLIWNKVTGADFYEVFISSNSSLASNWIKSYTTTSTQQLVDIILATNVNYYWIVRACQTNTGNTSLSSKNTFIVKTTSGGGGDTIGTYSDSVSFTNDGLYWGQMYVMNPADTISSIRNAAGDANASDYVLDNTTERIAFIFNSTNTTTVDRLRIRLENEGVTYGVKIRLETVSNGIPTGNLVDTNSFILDFNANTWTYFYNNSVISLSNDKKYALVISKTGTDNNEIQVSEFADNSDNSLFWNGLKHNGLEVLYSSDGSSYNKIENILPIFAMRGTSGVPNVSTPFNFGKSVWTTNSLGIGEVFSPGSDITISGLEFYAKRRGTSSHKVKVIVSKITNLSSPDIDTHTNIFCEMKDSINDKKWFGVTFPTNIVLKAGEFYSLKLFITGYDSSSDCIIFPAGAEWYDFTHVVPNGYAITLTNNHWGTVGSSKEIDSVFKFRVVKSGLSTVILSSPDNNSTITNDTTPEFKWNSVSGVTHYEFFISTNSNINVGYKYYYCGNTTSFEISDVLKTNINYFWCVRAVNSNTGASSVSEIRKIKVYVAPNFTSNNDIKENTVIDLRDYGLADPYPNIFESSSSEPVKLYFKSAESGIVTMNIYNVYGKLVKEIGVYSITANKTEKVEFVPSKIGLTRGVYFIVLKTPVSMTKKKIFVK